MQKFGSTYTAEQMDEYLNYRAPARPVRFCSVDLRDGQQSLIATRMSTQDVVSVIGKMDKVGFDSIEMWGGATFDSALRFLGENPFDRLRLAKKAAPNTPLRMLLRGQNIALWTRPPARASTFSLYSTALWTRATAPPPWTPCLRRAKRSNATCCTPPARRTMTGYIATWPSAS